MIYISKIIYNFSSNIYVIHNINYFKIACIHYISIFKILKFLVKLLFIQISLSYN